MYVEVSFKQLTRFRNARMELRNKQCYRLDNGEVQRQYMAYDDGDLDFHIVGKQRPLTQTMYEQIQRLYHPTGQLLSQRKENGKLLVTKESHFYCLQTPRTTLLNHALFLYEWQEQQAYERWLRQIKAYWYQRKIS